LRPAERYGFPTKAPHIRHERRSLPTIEDHEMNNLLTVLLASTLFGLVAATAGSEQQPSKPSFAISLKMPSSETRVGMPVQLKLSLTNTSNHDIHFYENVVSGPGFRNQRLRQMYIQVRDVNDKPVAESEYGKAIHGRGTPRPQVVEHSSTPGRSQADTVSRGVISGIDPGQISTEETDLTKEFDLSKPGKYTVQALRFDPASGQTVMSNKITFTIIE
jgi:hypothetical protein